MILAALGAEIWKVERPGSGDEARHMTPVLDDEPSLGAYFAAINRGKRSVALDLSSPEGVAVALRLAAQCDVFIENFRGGKARAMGIDESAVRAAQPGIIYASVAAFGPRGPDYSKPGYDALLQSRTGIVSVTGEPGTGGVRTGVSVLDMGTGIWVALGILAALLNRQQTGQGSRVDGSLFQTGAMWMAYHLVSRQLTGTDPKPQGMRIGAMAPYGAFSTADSRLLIGVSNDRLYKKLCEAIGLPELVSDARFATNPHRVSNHDELDRELQAILSTKTTAKWLACFEQAGIPASAIQTSEQLLADPQLEAVGQMRPIERLGGVASPSIPLGFSAFEVSDGEPPWLGEHTREVLESAGFTPEEIGDLERRRIVQCLATKAKSNASFSSPSASSSSAK